MNKKLLVQALSDSKAQILMAFLFAGHAMDVEEIQSWTGKKRETIYKTVDSLEAMGLLGRQVLAHGRQLFLPAGDILPLFQESTKWTPDPLIVDGAISKELVSSITTITTTGGQESTKRTPAEQAQLQAVLNEYQIMGKKRGQLIASEWVTADYVRAHVEGAQSENKWDQPVGMAITRMLENMPAPTKPNGQRNKYLDSQFIDLIEH